MTEIVSLRGEVIRCRSCQLNQFKTKSGNCRRCGEPYERPEPLQKQRKPYATGMIYNSPTPQGCAEWNNPEDDSYTLDVAFAMSLLRQAKDISQRRAQLWSGLPRTYFSKVERGKVLPNVKTFVKLCEAYCIEPEGVANLVECLHELRLGSTAQAQSGE